jgi:hypothetical protein
MRRTDKEDTENNTPNENQEISEIQRKIKVCLRWMWIRGRRNARKNTIANWLITIATWGAFIAAAIYAGIAASQLPEMRSATEAAITSANAAKDSVTLARKNAHFDQRAWLGISYGTYVYKVGEPFAVTMHVVDTGKSPARNVHGEAVTVFLERHEKLVFSYDHGTSINMGTMFQTAPQDAISWLIPTGIPKEGKIQPLKISTRMEAALKSGSGYIVVYGRLNYDTVFSGHHWIQFCAPSTAMEFNQSECTEYNQIDTEEEP